MQKYKMSVQMAKSIMMAFQIAIAEQVDIMEIFDSFEIVETDSGLVVVNPPVYKKTEHSEETEETE